MTLVSVLVPVLNGAATIDQALESLRAQTLQDFEALVVDDGSTDDTVAQVESWAATDPRIRLFKLGRNYGVSHARNVGLDHAKSPWVALLDADDWYEPQRLEKLVQGAQALEADAVFDDLLIFDHALGRIVERTRFARHNRSELLTAEELFEKDTPFARHAIGYAQPLVRRDFLVRHGIRYNEEYRLNEDFAFLAEMVLQGARVYALPFAAYIYRQRLSPTTGGVSPFSRSDDSYAQVVKTCEDLMVRYGAGLSGRVVQALRRRQFLFERLKQGRVLRHCLRERNWRGLLWWILFYPGLVLFTFRIKLGGWLRRLTLLFLMGEAADV